MAKDYQRLWRVATDATGEVLAVQSLAEIVADKAGRVFISRLDSGDAELCVKILDNVSRDPRPPNSHLRLSRQGIPEHILKPAEKQALFDMLRKLAGRHGLLPGHMRITEKVEVSDEILASGGFADLRSGSYGGHLVAMKTFRVSARDDFVKIRKVSV